METQMKKSTKEKWLNVAEVFDAYRTVPRLFLIMYGVLVYKLYDWFISMQAHVQTACDSALIRILIESGVDIEQAQELACTVVGTIGGPTTQQAGFVTAIIGLSSVIFMFYINSGRNWGGEMNRASFKE